MDEENYKLLLEQNEQMKKDIEELRSKINEVTTFNRALLNKNVQNNGENDEEKERKELTEKLGRCLRNGK